MSQIRITIRRSAYVHAGEPRPAKTDVRYFPDVSAAAKYLIEDSYFQNENVSEVVYQVLPDGPDCWPLPGYDEGYAYGCDSTLDYYTRNPDELPAPPATDGS